MKKDFDREKCIGLLKKKADELSERGESRFPRRSDFSEEEVVAVKAFLGPWPRALEASGLKADRSDDLAEARRQKRRRAKIRRRENAGSVEDISK
ncbi:MAG: hypothetical protein ACI4XQ_00235 [Eubacteriales bacterium]